MPEVSILMNCYNGEEFLKEAIDSVYLQTFKDWEIIFIDNCSTDSSAEIIKSYDDKIKYFKTDQNIPLGSARNFGVKFCNGRYIAFLDTDDVWLEETLIKLVDKIKSGDYILAYGGLINIDLDGNKVSTQCANKKSGYIFESLLKYYDIPIVSSIICAKKLKKSGLYFDKKIKASEEYCLFMQLSVDHKIGVINEFLVKYRILGNSLTQRSMSLWFKERNYTLNKIRYDNNLSQMEFKSAFRKAYSRADYYQSLYEFSVGNKSQAINIILRVALVDIRYTVLLFLYILPKPLFYKTFKFKYGRPLD